MLLWWDIVRAIFSRLRWTHIREIIFVGEVFQITVFYSSRLLYLKMRMASLRSASVGFSCFSLDFCNQSNHIGALKICYDLFWIIYLSVIYNNTGGSTKRLRNLSSAFEKADSQWGQKCRSESWQKKLQQVLFLQNHVEKGTKISHQITLFKI